MGEPAQARHLGNGAIAGLGRHLPPGQRAHGALPLTLIRSANRGNRRCRERVGIPAGPSLCVLNVGPNVAGPAGRRQPPECRRMEVALLRFGCRFRRHEEVRPRARPAGALRAGRRPARDEPPVLIQALTGFVDAGNATGSPREHLRSRSTTRLTSPTFDVDQLLDYRSRRPPMIFVEDHWESYEEPELELHLLHDDRRRRRSCCWTGPSPTCSGSGSSAAVTRADRAARRAGHGRAQRDPDGRAAHPADSA